MTRLDKNNQRKSAWHQRPSASTNIELHADRMPTVESVEFEFGEIPAPPPTEEIQKYKDGFFGRTGDLYDDPEDVLLARLIFGESRDQPKEAKAGVAWTVKNRLLAKRSDWGFSYHDVIQQPGQYAAFDPHDDNFPKLTDPFNTGEVGAREAWHGSYEVAQGVIKGTIKDPADGAVFFHSADYSQEKFTTEDVPGAVFIKQIGTILFYKK